jgi:membrane protease YdiL (CAAX protease family)
VTAGIVSALAFTSHHVLLLGVLLGGFGPATWLLALAVAAAGGAWAWLYHKTGSLLAPWASHALADAGLMWIGFRMWTAADIGWGG